MIKIISVAILLTACLAGMLPLHAEEKQVADIVAAIQERYKPINTVESAFVQKNFIAALNQYREFRGKIFLKRPYLFEMQVTSPEVQRLIFDGKFFWLYTATNNQALKNPVAPEFMHHPLISLLATMGNLDRHFLVSLVPSGNSSGYSLQLRLRQLNSDIREVLLTVERSDFRIKELALYYESGNYTTLTLTAVKENLPVHSEHFEFVPPPDTEIVESPTPVVQP